MTVTFCVLLRIMLLFTNKYIAFLGVVFSYGILAATYDLGNYTEEYSLLFITVSMYLGIKFLLKNETETKEHPWKYAIWYGISFAAIALMRVTSAFAICCIILVILCILVKNKLWKNIGQNILAFGVGMCIVFFSICDLFCQ